MLEIVLQADPPREHLPVSADMIDSLRKILADDVEDGYDTDAVFFTLALAVYKLENRIFEMSLRLPPPE